ncbi:MAG: peptidoglycan-binding protein [Bryobacterales bacterium]|nr:peptidoglycan-binding protein [Bryobacterales bacterium]
MSLLVLLWTAGSAMAAARKRSGTTSRKSTSVQKRATKPPSKAKPYARSRTRAGSKAATRNRRAARSAPRNYGQTTPTPDRYREIQQALIERGYLKGEASGKWDAESVDAMRRFQQDQNIETSGQLDSLSLIALGLGPRRTAGAQARP